MDDPIYTDDDDFSQVTPEDDDFIETPPEEEYIEIEATLARPRFGKQETEHEKEAAQTHRQKPVPAPGNDAAGDAPSPAAENAAEGSAEEDAPVSYRYRITLVLAPDVETQINTLRRAVNLPDAEMGMMPLLPDFRTESLEDVQEILEEWVQDHLPMELTLESVEARTLGSQRYLAGWTLTPEEALLQAQEALLENLKQFIQPDDISLPFQARLVVADHTPPTLFPLLVREMQNQFDRLSWKIDALELLRAPENDSRWEVLEKFM